MQIRRGLSPCAAGLRREIHVLPSCDAVRDQTRDDAVHGHNLNATVLQLLGLDHERLTFKYQGREFRLTDGHGRIVKAVLE